MINRDYEVREKLKALRLKLGQGATAKKLGYVNGGQHICDIINGRKRPSRKIYKYFNIPYETDKQALVRLEKENHLLKTKLAQTEAQRDTATRNARFYADKTLTLESQIAKLIISD